MGSAKFVSAELKKVPEGLKTEVQAEQQYNNYQLTWLCLQQIIRPKMAFILRMLPPSQTDELME